MYCPISLYIYIYIDYFFLTSQYSQPSKTFLLLNSKPQTTMDFDDLEDVEATLGPKLVELREQKRAAPRMNSLGSWFIVDLDQWIRGIGWYKP